MEQLRLTAEKFAAALQEESLAVGEYRIEMPGTDVTLPVSLLGTSQGNETICYAFHGAVNQEIRSLPVFYGTQFVKRFPGSMTVISISDPGLRLSKQSFFTWYAGDEEFSTQTAISNLNSSIANIVKPNRTLFIGGSSGAHPALLHSHACKNSICLTVNPLASISAYATNLQRYLELCWPNRSEGKNVADYKDDIQQLYASGYTNKVIVLQNCFDMHMKKQILPLAQSLAGQNDYLFLSEFFAEHIGHKYPAGPLDEWVGATLSVDGGDLEEIARIACRQRHMASSNSEKPPSIMKSSYSKADLEVADRIAKYLSRNSQ